MDLLSRIIEDVEDALKSAKMTNASFNSINGSTLTRHCAIGEKRAECEPTEETKYIVERTRIYRETWIVAPLEFALAELKRHQDVLRSLESIREMAERSPLFNEAQKLEHLMAAGRRR